jgi:glycosyltransferase involved in cell wall biosynthesis
MLAYTEYESDNRVRRYAETLAKRGDRVEVIAYSEGNAPLGVREINGVTVHNVQRRDSHDRRMGTYVGPLLRFLWTSSVLITRRHRKVRYNVVHVHNIPDFLVFAAWFPKLTGASLILDIHDIVPECFVNKFERKADSWLVKSLKLVERASAGFANHVVVSNDIWRDTLVQRSVSAKKCSVFLNHVDQDIFYRRSRTRDDGRFIILFPGSYQWHQGLDIAVEAFAHIKDAVPNAEFHMYGEGPMRADLERLISKLGLQDRVKFCGSSSLDAMAGIIANADLGVVPKRADSFGNEAYSTKIMEFMSQGVPVVVSRTKIDALYFDDSTVQFFTSGDPRALAEAMLTVIRDPSRRAALIENGYQYVDRHGWESRRKDYLDLVDSLCSGGRGTGEHRGTASGMSEGV